jgi:hypothetical protein
MIKPTYTSLKFWISWVFTGAVALGVCSKGWSQPTYSEYASDPSRSLRLDFYSTRPWLKSPNVSPYLLLEDPNPFDSNDEVTRYYLLVRPNLDYEDSLRRAKPRKTPSHPAWTPYRSKADYTPYPLRRDSAGASRFLNYGTYYPYYPYYAPYVIPPTNSQVRVNHGQYLFEMQH